MDILPATFVLFVISAAFTPGPNNIMIMSSGLNFGTRASLPHFFGICFGFPSMFLAVGFGLGYLFERFALLHSAIQIIGTLYLFYLAWLIAMSSPTSVGQGRAAPLTFFQAALFQWVNPKAWIMGTSAIAAYTSVGAEVNVQILAMALVFWVMTFPSAGVWLFFGVGLKRLVSDPKKQRIFNIGMALLLVASIIPIVVELFERYF